MDYHDGNQGKINRGHVYLVGAGPGSADLITVRGLRLLQRCDTVVYDRLAGEELLSETKPSCERIYAGKRGGHPSMTQEEINHILLEKAAKGRMVVRLKGGDPFVFGRGGEEAECLMQAQIPFTYVPGVTSAVSVPGLAGIPVTHRELSRSFHVITAHTTDRDEAAREVYLRSQIEGVKAAEGTLIFLMGCSCLEMICRLLLESGKPPQFPAAVVARGTRYDETVISGTISDLAGRVREANVKSPAIIIAGDTASFCLRTESSLPLSGVRIGLTGTRALTERLSQTLREAGAETVWVQELFVHKRDGQEQYFENLSVYTWIVFTSANGVRIFWEQMRERNLDVRILGGVKVAVIGSGTADCLREYGLWADYMPDTYTAGALAAGLLKLLDRERDRVLLYQAREGNPVLEETFRRYGINTERAFAYTVEAGELHSWAALDTLTYLTFASSSGVRGFIREDPERFARKELRHLRAVAIGEKTAQALAGAGCKHIVTAASCTVRGLTQAIVEDMQLRGR